MELAPALAAAASFSAGTVSASAAAGFAGRPTPAPSSCRWTSGVVRYCRKSEQAGSAAWVVQEKPSPPPSTAFGSPAPPLTAGNGNQPSLEFTFLSGVRLAPAPGSQSPWSSIAALPLTSRPTELLG